MNKQGCCTTRHACSHEEYNAKRRAYELTLRRENPDYKLRVYKYRATEKGKATVTAYKERHNRDTRKWYWSNIKHTRLIKLMSQERRRARLAGTPGDFTPKQIQDRVEYYGGKCYICGAPWEHLDHVVPLVMGGTNWPSNLRPACSSCNLRKSTHRLIDFLSLGT